MPTQVYFFSPTVVLFYSCILYKLGKNSVLFCSIQSKILKYNHHSNILFLYEKYFDSLIFERPTVMKQLYDMYFESFSSVTVVKSVKAEARLQGQDRKVMEGIKGIKFLLRLFFLLQLENSFVLATIKSCLPLSPTKVNVHLIPHSHDDVGWIQTVDEYYRNRVRSIYDTVIEALWADKKRR